MLDQASLDHMAREEKYSWPWPRDIYEPLLHFLKRGGASAVAFDLLFTEHACSGVESDVVLGRALADTLPAVVAAAVRRDDGAVGARPAPVPSAGRSSALHTYLAQHPRGGEGVFSSAVLPVPEIVEGARALGNVTEAPDQDGIFRHHTPRVAVDGADLLSLPFALFALLHPDDDGGFGKDDPRNGDGALTLSFAGDGSFDSYAFDAVIRSEVRLEEGGEPFIDPALFQGSIVLVGANAPGILDLRPVPVNQRYPGVYYNATVLDNLLQRRFVRDLPVASNFGMAAVWIVMLVLLIAAVRRARLQFVGITLVYVLFIAAAIVLTRMGYWAAIVPPFAGMLAATILGLLYQYQTEGARHRFIRKAFAQYVSPALMQRLVDNPERLTLGGERRELTIFFSDIQGFSTFSEKLDPVQLAALLNRYLTLVTDIILANSGTLDKYEGDAVVAFWNAPLDVEDHPRRAVAAALRIQEALEQAGARFKEEFGVEPITRIGIHTGPVSVGNFGSRAHFDYTVIGDAANLASRLEGVNKVFGTSILISEKTHELLAGSIACRKIGAIQVVGKREVLGVYEPLRPGQPQYNRQDDWAAALRFFEENRRDRAEELFQRLDGDPAAKAYLERLAEEGAVEAPDPVWRLKNK